MSTITWRVRMLQVFILAVYCSVPVGYATAAGSSGAGFISEIQLQWSKDCVERTVKPSVAELDEVIGEIEDHVETHPEDAQAFYEQAVAYQEKRDYGQALIYYEQALTLDPNLAKAYFGRGRSYSLQGETKQAIEEFTKGLSFDPTDAKAFYSRGRAYMVQGESEKAIADFKESLRLDSTDACSHNNLAVVYERLGNSDLVLHHLNRAIELEPTLTRAVFNRGRFHYDRGNYELALQDFNTAISQKSDDARYFEFRAKTLFKLNRKPEGDADLKRSAALRKSGTESKS